MNKIELTNENILQLFKNGGASKNTCKIRKSRICRIQKIFGDKSSSFDFLLDVNNLVENMKLYQFSYVGQIKTYDNNSLKDYFSTIGIFSKEYGKYYNDERFITCYPKWAKQSKSMSEVEDQRKLIFGMTNKLKNEIQNINYIEMANKVKHEWEKHKYSKTKTSEYFIMLALASLMFRNIPRRSNTLANVYFIDKCGPKTVKREINKNYLLRSKKSQWYLLLIYYKPSAKKTIMRDYPKRCKYGIQIIKIIDPISRSILSKMVKQINTENPIFGDATNMLSLIKKFTENKNMTLRAIRPLATNNFYKNMWKNNDPKAKEKYSEFLFKMGHSEYTSKNNYLTPKEIFNDK